MAKITATSNVASGSTGAKRVVKSSESFSIDSSKITHTSPNVTAKNLNLAIEEIATQHAVATSEPSSPVEGDLWYDTDDNLFYVRVDSAWKQVYPVDLNVLATETVIADGDFIPMVDISDSNASGKITFENLEDAIFSSVSGDIAIAENGAATIQANSVALGGDTTGNYVEAVTGGTGIDSTGATSGEAISHTLSLDLNELATETTIADADFITMVDTSDSNASDKITFANVQSAIVATGALNSGSITSGFGAIDIGSSGLTAGSTSLSALSLLDGNITNVGSIQLDSIAGDGDTNTSIEFSGSDVITVSTGGETQVTFNNGSILPTTDNDVDLGSSSYEFKDGYFDGTVYADAINFNGTAIGSTAAELNLLDGSAKSTSSITIADADAFIVIDGTTTKQIPASDLETYMESSLDTLSNVTTVGTLNSGSISSGFGAIDIGTSGLTAGSTSLTGLSLLDGNITNAGDINCDSISIDDAAVGLNIDFGGNTTLNKITLTDNLADALNITESSNSYLKFVTSNSGEKITLGKKLEAGSVEIEGSAFDIDGGTIDGTDVTVGSGKTLDVSGGTLTLANDQISGDKVSGGTIGTTTITALAGALSLGDNNITNVSDIALDSISADTTDINVAVSDNSATAFTIKQGSDAYLVIDTANSSESVAIGTGISGTGITIGHSTSETTVADNLTVTGNLKVNGDTVTQNVSTMTVNDPIISLQTADDGANLGSDSNKDVGLAMFYHTGSAAKTAFLGWDDSAGKLTFVPDASISSEVVSGSVGTIVANLEGDVTGDVAGNVSGTAATVTGAAQTNITSLGTLTALTVDNLGVNGNTITANSGALNLTPASGSAIVLDGTINVDAGVVTGATSITSTAFVGDITGDVTGTADLATSFTASANNSADETVYPVFVDDPTGTQGAETDTGLTYNPSTGRLTATQLAGTLQTAAQSNITSLGTLTALTVDSIAIDGTTIGHTGDTDLLTLGSGALTVAGEVSMTTLDIGGTDVTSTAAELNLIAGGTSRGTTAVASGDGILINDGGTMRMTNVDTVSTYFSSHNVGGGNIVTTGALNSGSITSGFGTIDIGSSGLTAGSTQVSSLSILDGNITHVGDISLDSISADGTDINILVDDNSATALTIKQGSDAYLIVDTANGSESVSIGTGISATAISIGHSTSETTINDNLVLTGDADFNGALDVDGTSNLDDVDIDGTVDMASTLTVAGVIDSNDTTDSTSKTTGSAKFAGGVGIEKDLHVGVDSHVDGVAYFEGANCYIANSSGNTLIGADGDDQDIVFGTSIAGTSSFGDAKLEYNSTDALFQITHPNNSGGSEPTFRFSKKYGAAGGAIGGISAHYGDGTQPAAQMNFQAVGHTGGEFHFYISADTGTLSSNTGPSLGLKVNSAAVISGPSDTYHTPSDVSLKENITTISNALEAVKQLRGVEFTWKPEHDPYKKTNEEDEDDSRLGQKNIGFIAQEVEVIAPHLVRSHPDTKIKSISDSNQMSAYIVEAIKELTAKVEALENA